MDHIEDSCPRAIRENGSRLSAVDAASLFDALLAGSRNSPDEALPRDRERLLRWADGLADALALAAAASRWMTASELEQRFAVAPMQLLALDAAGHRLAARVASALAQLGRAELAVLALCCAFEDGLAMALLGAQLATVEQLRASGWVTRVAGTELRWQVAAPLRALAWQQLPETTRMQAWREHAELVIEAAERSCDKTVAGWLAPWQAALELVIERWITKDRQLAQRAALLIMLGSRFELAERRWPGAALQALADGAERAALDHDASWQPQRSGTRSPLAAQLELAMVERHIDAGSFDDALLWLRMALRSAASAAASMTALTYQGHLLTWQGRYAEAQLALDQAAACHDGATTLAEYGGMLVQRAFLALRRRDDGVLDRLDSAVRYATLHQLPRALAICSHLRGRALLLQAAGRAHELELARNWLLRAGRAFAEQGDARATLFNRAFLSASYRRQGMIEQAHATAAAAYRRVTALDSEAIELLLLIELELSVGLDPIGKARAATLRSRTQMNALRQFAQLALNTEGLPILQLNADATQLVVDGVQLDLSKRDAPRRMLAALCCHDLDAAGHPLAVDTLFRAGWPGQRIAARSRIKRVQTAVWTLRSMGLGQLIDSSAEGYLLRARVRWQAQPAAAAAQPAHAHV